MRPRDTITLSGLSFDSVIGVYPSERSERQAVVLDVALGLDTRPAAYGDIAGTVDYARLSGELKFLMHACRFALLETAAEALCRYVLAPPTADQPRAQVESVTVVLKKPNVQAAVQVTRDAAEYRRRRTLRASFGHVQPLFETRDLGIYRVALAARARWRANAKDAQHLVLGDELSLHGERVLAGSAFFWPAEQVFDYSNASRLAQTLLVVARPRMTLATTRQAGKKPPPPVSYYPPEHALPHQTQT